MSRGEELFNRLVYACAEAEDTLSKDDFLALAMAAIDQANVPLSVQRVVAKTLNVDLCPQCCGIVPDEDRAGEDPSTVQARDEGYCSAICWEDAHEGAREARAEQAIDDALEARDG